jgi:PAS domain S-box-containing protein
MPYQNTELYTQLKFWSKGLSAVVIGISLLVILGWQFDIERFKRPIPTLVAMNPLTAVLFILSASTVFIALSKKEKRSFVIILSTIVFSLSFLKLLGLLMQIDFHIDSLLFSDKLNNDLIGKIPNRMAPNTAFSFMLAGVSLALIQFQDSTKQVFAQILSLSILFLGLLSLLGYLYQVESFYGVFKYIPMAVHTALTFLLLSLAILFMSPDTGIMRSFTASYSGSASARLLIPAVIIIPTLLGYLRLLGDWQGLYSKEFGVAILILSIIILFFILIWLNATSLNKKDALRKTAEENLIKLNAELEQIVEIRTKEIINNERRFRSMIENSEDIISLIDEDNKILYINSAVEKISRYSISEIMQLKRHELVAPEDRATALKNIRTALENPGKPFSVSLRIINKEGRIVWLEGTMNNMLHDESIKAIVSNYRDVTERKESEKKLMESELKIWNTLDKMMEGIQIIDRNWKYMYVNEAVASQGKHTREELLGHTMMEVYPGIENTELFNVLSRCMDSRKQEFLVNEFEYNDGSKGWFELSIQPVPEGVFILSIDITKRKAAEASIQKLNEELEARVLERTVQLETVNKELESFSYSVSHDLRAPLRAINGYAKMIEEDYASLLDEEGKRLLTTVQYNAQKMGNLIDDLLAFSRLGRKEIQTSEIDVKEMINGTINEINKNVKHHAEFKIGKLENLHGDYALINQVFYNLISNAVKYSSKVEKPIIRINSEIKGNEVIYQISDNGAGFNMQYGHKLFGVFQRLHGSDEFEGTGVGLAIVQRIISKHKGRVWAEAKVNEGADFYFTLPLK